VESAARFAHESADAVAMIATDPEWTTIPAEGGDRPVEIANERCREMESARWAAELGLRRLAQLAFGVSAMTYGGDRIERLDRASVAVLHPPFDIPKGIAQDTPRLFARTEDELEVEVSGILCRLLIDRVAIVNFAAPDGRVRFGIDDADSLVGSVWESHDTDLSDLGWSSSGDSWSAQWTSPVTISEPAGQTVRTLRKRLGLSDIGQLGISFL
jgi:hypothetical protein